MKIVQTSLLFCLGAFAVVTLVLGVHDILFPPFSDEEIKASFVDTWQVSASVTSIILLALLGCFVTTVMFWWYVKQFRLRIAAGATLAMVILSVVATASAHIGLTERTTQLTGQSFGGWYGLP